MHVPHQPALGGDAAKVAERLGPLLHRAFEMRDAADDIDAHVQRADHIPSPGLRPIQPVLREGDQLQVQIGRDASLHLQHRLDPAQMVGRGVDMGSDRQQPHADCPVAIGHRPVDHFVHRGKVAQLSPQRDSFQQRARGIHPGQAIGQGSVHVEMRVDEGGGHKVPGRVDHAPRVGVQTPHRRDPIPLDADIGHRAIRQRAALDQKIEHSAFPLVVGQHQGRRHFGPA